MKRRFAPIFQRMPRAVALMLCLWLSGAMCVLSCHLTPVHAGETVEKANATEKENLPSCHRKNAHSKTEKSEENKNAPSLAGFNPMPARFCVFANITLESAKSFQLQVVEQQAQTVKLELPKPVFAASDKFSYQQSYKPPPLDRGGTYLRCCVLLI